MPRRHPDEDGKRVRLNFQLCASDNPLLVAELLGLRKGKLRHARLVTLATIGLLTESRVVAGESLLVAAIGHGEMAGREDGMQLRPFTDDLLNDVDMPEHG